MAGPDVWGPPGWKFIHFVTMGYPNYPTESIKKKYYDYFHSLKNVIPCSICALHFAENLEKLPLDDNVLGSKEKLVKWGIDIHNVVNKKNGKKEYTYEEGIKEILKPICGKGCCNNKVQTQTQPQPQPQSESFQNKKEHFTNNNDIINIILIISIILNLFLIFVFISNHYKK
jgi:hypothetical protein